MTLRENSLYRLPNGREVRAIKINPDKWLLKNMRAQEEDIPEYKIHRTGRLLVSGKLTAWSVEDLLEAIPGI